jgi:phage gpG-like protein
MAQTGVHVEGLRQLVRELEGLGVEVGDLKDAFGNIARRGAEVTKGFVPQRSGRLANTVRGNRAKNKAVVTVGKASAPYAAVINYGFPARSIKGAGFVPQTDRVMEPEAVAEITNSLNQIIRKRGL